MEKEGENFGGIRAEAQVQDFYGTSFPHFDFGPSRVRTENRKMGKRGVKERIIVVNTREMEKRLIKMRKITNILERNLGEMREFLFCPPDILFF